MCKFVKGMAMGAVIGAAVGLMMIPNLDRKTQRSMRKAAKRMRNVAEDTYDGMIDWIR